jgi:predicted amidohydrolase YtcJ
MFTHGRVITCDAACPKATSLAVRGDRIVWVGEAPPHGLVGPSTRVVNLRGRTLIPGFNDSHNHMLRAGLALRNVQLRDCKDLAGVLARIATRAKARPPGEWIVASGGWHEASLAEKRLPTREELDAAAPNHPVYVPRGGHTAVANSLALRLAGVDERTPDPPGGAFVKAPATGRLTGQLFETPAMLYLERLLPQPSFEDKAQALREIQVLYNRAGITSVRDPGLVKFPGFDAEDFAPFLHLWRHGELTVRVNLMYGVAPTTDPDRFIAALELQALRSGFGDGWMRLGGLKLMADGGVETAWLRDPYASDPSSRGVQIHSREFLLRVLRAARRLGWEAGVHCVGDAAVEMICGLYEAIHREMPLYDQRWAIEHAILADGDQSRRLAAMGVGIAAHSLHLYTLGQNMVKHWGTRRATAAYPQRTWMDLGINVAGGTDANICPHDQLLALHVDVTRETEQVGILGPEQAMLPLEALVSHTLAPARLTSEAHLKGSLVPGKVADLVVLSGDPTGEAGRIRDIQVLMTVVGGRVVFESDLDAEVGGGCGSRCTGSHGR